ncbi:MAG: hypothetical protein AB1726_04825 [Planctomycetota bacterium]
MKLVRRILARNRLRTARRALSTEPSPATYAALAKEYAQLGMMREVRQVCEEGLVAFPRNAQLVSLGERARHLEREARMVELKRALSDAPRPALWMEMCEILLDSGLLARAEETATRWCETAGSVDSRLMLARVRLERFLADRGRDQGLRVLETLDAVLGEAPGDMRAWRLRMQFMTQIGAWREARRCAAQLLQLAPGDPVLEARFRTLDTLADEAPSVEKALLEVERTGELADERKGEHRAENLGSVRPLLRSLASEPDVHSALYVRGSTVLVQGPRGATAERMARAVKSILTASRASGRRLGLGQIGQIQLDGDFGTLTIAPGEMDAGALWTKGPLDPAREASLLGLAGMTGSRPEASA